MLAIGVIAVLLASPAGLTVIQNTVALLFGSGLRWRAAPRDSLVPLGVRARAPDLPDRHAAAQPERRPAARNRLRARAGRRRGARRSACPRRAGSTRCAALVRPRPRTADRGVVRARLAEARRSPVPPRGVRGARRTRSDPSARRARAAASCSAAGGRPPSCGSRTGRTRGFGGCATAGPARCSSLRPHRRVERSRCDSRRTSRCIPLRRRSCARTASSSSPPARRSRCARGDFVAAAAHFVYGNCMQGSAAARGRCSRSSPTATPRLPASASASASGGCSPRSRRSRPTSSCCASHASGTPSASSRQLERDYRRAPPAGARAPPRRAAAPPRRASVPTCPPCILAASLEAAQRDVGAFAAGLAERSLLGAVRTALRAALRWRVAISSPRPSSSACACAPTRSTLAWPPTSTPARRAPSRCSGSSAARSHARSASRARRAPRAAGARVRTQRRGGARAARGRGHALERQLRRAARTAAPRRVRARRELAGASARRRAARARRLPELPPRADVRAARVAPVRHRPRALRALPRQRAGDAARPPPRPGRGRDRTRRGRRRSGHLRPRLRPHAGRTGPPRPTSSPRAIRRSSARR